MDCVVIGFTIWPFGQIGKYIGKQKSMSHNEVEDVADDENARPYHATKAAINCGRNTLRRMMVSGNDSPITDIMNASTVPSVAPLPSNACTMGMIPAALEYIGTPISTASGTDHQAPLPMMWAMKFWGT